MNLTYHDSLPKAIPDNWRTMYQWTLWRADWEGGYIYSRNQAYQIVYNERARHLFDDRQQASVVCNLILVEYPCGLFVAILEFPELAEAHNV